VIIVTDILKFPIDEGAKVAALNLIQSYKNKYPCKLAVINGSCNLSFNAENFKLNKLLFSNRFYRYVKFSFSKKILYIPSQSITPATFVRAKLLQLFTGKDVHILSLQPKKYRIAVRNMVSVIRPASIITQSVNSAKELNLSGIRTNVLPLGVDSRKFCECDIHKKNKLRRKYSLDSKRKILLHIGHIKRSRNIEWLIEVKRRLPDVTILVVGSTTTVQDEEFHILIEKEGLIVIREYISNIEEMYQLADWYVFPVLKNDAAIETPLSVLEAMATNLPVLTTRFGSLPDTFHHDECFKFVNSPNDIVEALRNGFPDHCNNREKIKAFTWEAIADRLHELV
jgi:glycosyltransferase involved in cell wall biosynthesis